MFGFLTRRRRRRILERASIPDALWRATIDAVPALARLDPETQERLRALALLFLHEKRIEPAGGLVLDDAMRVRIAALACRPVLELGLDCYAGFKSVIVYPGEFVVRDREHVDESGVVHVGDDVLSGESWDFGPVVLGWEDVEASGQGDGYDVVAHEFAHKLDLLDGAVDGLPPLHREMRVAEWTAAFQSAYDDLVERVERGCDTWIDPYAAEDPGEFFAVCTELFFDVPRALARRYPDLYAQLAAFFKQDPAAGPGRKPARLEGAT
ncbi:MAG TPA: M90 family metallopeptidase [Gammaproteobacteria bacterium]